MSKELWVLVRGGRTQRYVWGSVKVWPVAESHEDAQRLCTWLRRLFPKTARAAPALVGSVAGETLAEHICMAIDEGCSAVYCVAGWNEDGSPEWKSIAFD